MAISVPQKFRFEDVSAASILLEHGPVEAEGPVLRLIVEGHELTSGQPQWHGIIVGWIDSAASRIDSEQNILFFTDGG